MTANALNAAEKRTERLQRQSAPSSRERRGEQRETRAVTVTFIKYCEFEIHVLHRRIPFIQLSPRRVADLWYR